MKISTKNIGSNYLAKLVRLGPLRKHPGADRLQLATIDHNTIITGMNAKEGDLYFYFPLECAINKLYLAYSNSFAHSNLNRDPNVKGFFDDNGRVRAVKLRGVPSQGYIVPLASIQEWLDTLMNFEFSQGDIEAILNKEFDTITLDSETGLELLMCEKYIPTRMRSKGLANTPKKDKAKRFDKLVEGQFRLHEDTAQLKKNLHQVHPDSLISISYKLHGTSMVASKILVKRQLTWKDRLARWFGAKVQETEYDVIYSSRSVIKNAFIYKDKTPNHWYKEDVWAHALKQIKDSIEDGITLYCEVVGQTPNGSWIQKNYDYGVPPKELQVYVYRITSTNASGQVIELTVPQVQRYCHSHGLTPVPVFFYGRAKEYHEYIDVSKELGEESLRMWRETLLSQLEKEYLEKPCSMCKNIVPAEGIVLTIEGRGFEGYKLKSFAFLEGETKALDSGDIGLEDDTDAVTEELVPGTNEQREG